MDELFRAIDGNRPGSLNDILRMAAFHEPLFDLLNSPNPGYNNCTPLLHALKRPGVLPEIVRLLLEAGSCTEAGPFGALHCALSAHQPSPILKLLFEFKADIYRLMPLEGGETDEKAGELQEFSLLHLALFVGASAGVIQLLCQEGGSLLINNQRNSLKETPLIFAIKRGLKFHDLASVSDLALVDANGLSAYACAAATLNPTLCLQLECLAVNAALASSSKSHHFSFGQIRRALNTFHRLDSLRLEILFAPADDQPHAGWCDFWGDYLEHGGPEHVNLPVDGYWQWCSEWQEQAIQDDSLEFNCKASILPPPAACTVQWFRLRKRKSFEESFLSEAVSLISTAENEYYDTEMVVTDGVINNFKQAFTLLMTGIRTCEDAQLKSQAADYLQLAMQRLDSIAPDQCTFAGSSLNLPTLASVNASTASLPAVTKTFPLQRLASKIFSSKTKKPTSPSAKTQDDLKFCPVCSRKLAESEDSRVEHLNACLTQSTSSIRGDRYTVHVLSSRDPRECPICCEEFVGAGGCESERIAVMNCLCRFHERCIERWFTRSPTCPFHSD